MLVIVIVIDRKTGVSRRIAGPKFHVPLLHFRDAEVRIFHARLSDAGRVDAERRTGARTDTGTLSVHGSCSRTHC